MTLLNTLPSGDVIANFIRSKALIKTLSLLVFSGTVLLLSSCSKQPEVSRLKVEVWHNGVPINCEKIDIDQQQWLIRQLGFFVSELTFSSLDTTQKPDLLSSPWQTNNVTLVKPQLADCNKAIEEVSNLDIEESNFNHWLTFNAPVNIDSSDALSFTLAVPFLLNHLNPLQLPSPLNIPSMFWSWRSGHKFFRIDLQAEDKNWVFHLGSVGCESASTMRAPQKECVQPNRLTFRLDKLHEGTKLVLHLDRLLQGATLKSSESCLFHGGQDSCQTLLENLQQQDVFEWH